MNEFVEQFVIEGRELVAQGNDDLLALEERPDDKERLDSAFRALHTLKGAAGNLGVVSLFATSEILEQLGRQNRFEAAEAAWRRLADEATHVLDSLRRSEAA